MNPFTRLLFVTVNYRFKNSDLKIQYKYSKKNAYDYEFTHISAFNQSFDTLKYCIILVIIKA